MIDRLVLGVLCGAVIGSAFVVILVRWLLAPLVDQYAEKADEAAYEARQAAAAARYMLHGRPHDERMADDHKPYGGDQPRSRSAAEGRSRHIWRD